MILSVIFLKGCREIMGKNIEINQIQPLIIFLRVILWLFIHLFNILNGSERI